MAKKKLQGRVRYEENYNGEGEYYIFEIKCSDESEWGLETAFSIKDDMIHYTALTTIRQWQRLGMDFWFA